MGGSEFIYLHATNAGLIPEITYGTQNTKN